MSDYKIEKITKQDVKEINAILLKELSDTRLAKKTARLIRGKFAYKMIDVEKKELAGFCMMTEYPSHFGLDYYYIVPFYRRKSCSFFFFMYCLSKTEGKNIYVKKNKNYKDYEKYFTATLDANIVRFTNLREEKQWVELLVK